MLLAKRRYYWGAVLSEISSVALKINYPGTLCVSNENMEEILQYLKVNGERFDTEIAAAVGLALVKARSNLNELASTE